MKDPQFEQWRQIGWRRKLTPDEQQQLEAWLLAHPEEQFDLESEADLTEALSRLPSVPVPSNFTARVLEAAQRDQAAAHRALRPASSLGSWWRKWLPKAAVAAVALAAGVLSYNHLQEEHRAEVARSLTAVSQIPAVQSTDILSDFDTIAAMDTPPVADEELLRVMQ